MAENEDKKIEEEQKTEDEPKVDEAPKAKDTRSLGDKIDDGIDEVVANVQDFFYGERTNYAHDIPATMPDPDNEIRHINKVQTRRNFNKRYAKKFIKWMFIIIGVGLVVSLGYGLIEKLLMA